MIPTYTAGYAGVHADLLWEGCPALANDRSLYRPLPAFNPPYERLNLRLSLLSQSDFTNYNGII